MGHVHGPDGGRLSRSFGAAGLAALDPTVPERWRGVYGDTLTGRGEVSFIGGEPLENCS